MPSKKTYFVKYPDRKFMGNFTVFNFGRIAELLENGMSYKLKGRES